MCLTCDIRERAARGESSAAIAVRFGLPWFLVEATRDPDSQPTGTPGAAATEEKGSGDG